MSQPYLICQGILKFWIQQEWYQLTAVILAKNDNYSLTLTKQPLQSWLSNPSEGVILDMSISSVIALESASLGSEDGMFLILLFTKRSTHVLSALSEQDRIHWQGKFEQIIGEEWKFRVTIPCQQDLSQECHGVLRFNTKRRTVIVTYTQESRGLPAVLYHWTLKSIKSFGASGDLLVLDTSSYSGSDKSYFCFNTSQAEQILRVFREATGILPPSSDHAQATRNSARFADIDRVRRAIERNNSGKSQTAKSGVPSEMGRIDEDEILYEMADDGEEGAMRRGTRELTAQESVDSHSNPARLYHFPRPESEERDLLSHIHAVPVMEERIAQSLALKQHLNPDKVPRSVTPQNEFPEPRKMKKQDKPDTPGATSRKKRSRSRNPLRILSGRSTPRAPEDPSSRPPSPPPNFLHRAISKLRGPFHRSREDVLAPESGEISPRPRSVGRQKFVSETQTQFRNMKKSCTPVPATSHPENISISPPIQQIDRPIPPRHLHIPMHPSQPIIVQHPQPLHTSAQPGHFVPAQIPNNTQVNNQVFTPHNVHTTPHAFPMHQQHPQMVVQSQPLFPNQMHLNAHPYTQLIQQPVVWTHNVHTQPIQHALSPHNNVQYVIAPSNNAQQVIPPSNTTQHTISPSNNMHNAITPSNNVHNAISPSNATQHTISPSNNVQNPIPPSNTMQHTIPPSNTMQHTISPSNATQHTISPSNNMHNAIPTSNATQHTISPSNANSPHFIFPSTQQIPTETNLYNKLSAKTTVKIQTNAGIQPQLNPTHTNIQNTEVSTIPISHLDVNTSAPHRIIDTSSPDPLNVTSVISPPSGFKGTPSNIHQRLLQQNISNTPTETMPISSSGATSPISGDADIPYTDSGNYDHLSPSLLANSRTNAVFSGLPDILQPTHKSADPETPPNSQFRIPPGGQQTPLAIVHQEQQAQQGNKAGTDYRGVKRQGAFRCLAPTPSQSKNKPPTIAPKPTALSPNNNTESVQHTAHTAEYRQQVSPAKSPSTPQDPNLSTEC